MAKNLHNSELMDFYKQLIASDRRTIKSRKDFIKQSKINLKILKAKNGDNWFIEFYRKLIITDSEFIKEAQERIKENKQRIADLQARQEDKTTNVCFDWNKNIQEIMGNLQAIENMLDSTKRRQEKPKLTVIKGGLS